MTGYFTHWLGLAPDNSPLVLKDVGTQGLLYGFSRAIIS